jgi:hypothetical protein
MDAETMEGRIGYLEAKTDSFGKSSDAPDLQKRGGLSYNRNRSVLDDLVGYERDV